MSDVSASVQQFPDSIGVLPPCRIEQGRPTNNIASVDACSAVKQRFDSP